MKETYFLSTNNHEWLLTNGIGGYALGTGNLINQRKYHGLLISSDKKSNGNSGFSNPNSLTRCSLLSGMEIMIEWRGETFYIDSSNYSNCIYPEGFLHLVKSWLRPYPIFLYSSLKHNNDILILQEIRMADRCNAVSIKFTNLGQHQLHFFIRPKLTLRNHHHTNAPGCWDNDSLKTTVSDNQFSSVRVSNELMITGYSELGGFSEDKVIFHNCYYPWEAIRGYYGVEDQISPVLLTFALLPDSSNQLLFAANQIRQPDRQSILSKIESKYEKLPLPTDFPTKTKQTSILDSLDYDDNHLFSYNDYLQLLEFSLKDFFVEDDIIAGYPWFGCWGRDTFIAMSSFINLLKPENVDLVVSIWSTFNKYGNLINNGLLPNMLPESGQQGNYNSIDSCLWYVVRAYELINRLIELDRPDIIDYQIFTYCSRIVSGLLDNDTHPFFIGEDGLIRLKEELASATWMDANIDSKPVTPRDGAPVEINALFYNALCSFRDMQKEYREIADRNHNSFPQIEESRLNSHIELIEKSYPKFWNGHYLGDRIIGDRLVEEIRPNAIIAAALPFQLLSPKQLQLMIKTVEEELLTDYGLRSLSIKNYRFKKKYLGNQTERDSRYHQGTVWPYLFDFYVKTYLKAYEGILDKQQIVKKISRSISVLREEFMKGHIASVAEVYDGYNPKVSKGCPAQAWSIAALYNIEKVLEQLK